MGVLKELTTPVASIGVGNLAAGGTGKTPMVDYLLSMFADKYSTALVSRGYKRKSEGCVVCNHQDNEDIDINSLLGDEAAMLYSKYPNLSVAVCKERNEAVKQLMDQDPHPQLILFDDVFQHRYVKPTVSILLTEYNRPYSSDHVLPFGNLREPRSSSRRANVIIVTKSPRRLNSLERRSVAEQLKVKKYQKIFFSYIEYGEPKALFSNESCNLENAKHIVCVTGIAHPDSLLAELKCHGRRIEHLSFSDHHNYTSDDIDRIVKTYDSINSPYKMILTTEKDAIRLKNSPNADKLQNLPFFFLPMATAFHDENGYGFESYITSIVRENMSFLDRLEKSTITNVE